MISRVSGASVALLALLAVAPACFAQEPVLPPLTPPAADTLTAATPRVTPLQVTKRGSFGGRLGWGRFLADGDYSHARDANGGYGEADTRSRPTFDATFRYQVSSWLRWQLSPAYTWAGYQEDSPLPFTDPNFPSDSTKEQVLTQLLPLTFELHYTKFARGGWLYHAGAGPGLYKVWVQNRRKVLADPVTYERHSGWYWGLSGEIGAARALKSLPSVSIEGAVDGHWVFAEGAEKFPSGFNKYLFAMGLKVGANYHFDTRRFFRSEKKAPGPAGTPAGR